MLCCVRQQASKSQHYPDSKWICGIAVSLALSSPLRTKYTAAAPLYLSSPIIVSLLTVVYGDLASKLKALISTEATAYISEDVGWIWRPSSGDSKAIGHGFHGLFAACSINRCEKFADSFVRPFYFKCPVWNNKGRYLRFKILQGDILNSYRRK